MQPWLIHCDVCIVLQTEDAECNPGPKTIQVLGTRKLTAPRTCGRVADFTFEELCAKVNTVQISLVFWLATLDCN